jgi:hypothetical protein
MAPKSTAKKDAAEEVVTKSKIDDVASKIKAEKAEEAAPKVKLGQGRPVLGRFRLQVDRQIKSAFDNFDDAEKAGQAIKKAYPLVQVSIYDAVGSEQKILS